GLEDKTMQRHLIGALALLATLVAAPAAHAERPQFFRIVSTSPGGLWHTFGMQLADKLQRAFPEVSISHRPGGSNQNHRLVSTDKAQMGFSFTPVSLEAHTGTGDFDRTWPDARVIGTFYAAYLHPVLRGGVDVEHISDLRDKVVSPGK